MIVITHNGVTPNKFDCFDTCFHFENVFVRLNCLCKDTVLYFNIPNLFVNNSYFICTFVL